MEFLKTKIKGERTLIEEDEKIVALLLSQNLTQRRKLAHLIGVEQCSLGRWKQLGIPNMWKQKIYQVIEDQHPEETKDINKEDFLNHLNEK